MKKCRFWALLGILFAVFVVSQPALAEEMSQDQELHVLYHNESGTDILAVEVKGTRVRVYLPKDYVFSLRGNDATAKFLFEADNMQGLIDPYAKIPDPAPQYQYVEGSDEPGLLSPNYMEWQHVELDQATSTLRIRFYKKTLFKFEADILTGKAHDLLGNVYQIQAGR